MSSPTDELIVDLPVPKGVGIYAFVKDGSALYVGVATMGISKRLYFYGRPGISQRTSKRLNALFKGDLLASGSIDIYVAIPPDLEWNGLRAVSGSPHTSPNSPVFAIYDEQKAEVPSSGLFCIRHVMY